jgi:hypothetical protein
MVGARKNEGKDMAADKTAVAAKSTLKRKTPEEGERSDEQPTIIRDAHKNAHVICLDKALEFAKGALSAAAQPKQVLDAVFACETALSSVLQVHTNLADKLKEVQSENVDLKNQQRYVLYTCIPSFLTHTATLVLFWDGRVSSGVGFCITACHLGEPPSRITRLLGFQDLPLNVAGAVPSKRSHTCCMLAGQTRLA